MGGSLREDHAGPAYTIRTLVGISLYRGDDGRMPASGDYSKSFRFELSEDVPAAKIEILRAAIWPIASTPVDHGRLRISRTLPCTKAASSRLTPAKMLMA